MKKIAMACSLLALMCGCSKHDPILPGVRTAIFDDTGIKTINENISGLPATADTSVAHADCPYTQDSSNVIWYADRKIFSGFPTANAVKSAQTPICVGNYVIAGLTTGEVVKVNPKNRQIAWVADVYRPSNMTGGASVVDIVAPLFATNQYLYVGGLGDAFCKINLANGAKKWCTPISVSGTFIIAGPAAFVIGANNTLHAIRTTDGAEYWNVVVDKKCTDIKYESGVITACKKKIDAQSGVFIK